MNPELLELSEQYAFWESPESFKECGGASSCSSCGVCGDSGCGGGGCSTCSIG